MKKVIVAFLLLIAFNLQAQFTVTKVGTATQVNNNDVLTYNSIGDNAAEFKFNINNITNAEIKVKIKIIRISNANGTLLQFCFAGSCITGVTEGVAYPIINSYTPILPVGGNNGNFDHFRNDDPGNGTSNVDYVLKFYQIDNSGNEIGNSITCTYRYDPLLAIVGFSSLDKLGVQLSSTLVENQLDIISKEPIQLFFYDIIGKKVKNTHLISGVNSIEVNNLVSGIFILNFIDEKGNKAIAKIIKK